MQAWQELIIKKSSPPSAWKLPSERARLEAHGPPAPMAPQQQRSKLKFSHCPTALSALNQPQLPICHTILWPSHKRMHHVYRNPCARGISRLQVDKTRRFVNSRPPVTRVSSSRDWCPHEPPFISRTPVYVSYRMRKIPRRAVRCRWWKFKSDGIITCEK